MWLISPSNVPVTSSKHLQYLTFPLLESRPLEAISRKYLDNELWNVDKKKNSIYDMFSFSAHELL